MFQVPELLFLDPGPFNSKHRVGRKCTLGIEEPVKRGKRGDHPVECFWFVIPDRVHERQEISYHHGLNLDIGIEAGIRIVLPEVLEFLGIAVSPEPQVVGKLFYHLLVTGDGPGGIIPHSEVVSVAIEPLGKITTLHGLFFIQDTY